MRLNTFIYTHWKNICSLSMSMCIPFLYRITYMLVILNDFWHAPNRYSFIKRQTYLRYRSFSCEPFKHSAYFRYALLYVFHLIHHTSWLIAAHTTNHSPCQQDIQPLTTAAAQSKCFSMPPPKSRSSLFIIPFISYKKELIQLNCEAISWKT